VAVLRRPASLDDLGFIRALVLLWVRGVLLWIVVPAATALWFVLWPVWHRRHVSIGALLGWADLGLTALLARAVAPSVVAGLELPPLKDASSVTHRIGFFDAA
jgi:hypothetical protein